ncbi:inter-alpha-trypsin inhibitor heavy chain H3-like [Gigantopelta aegis]|uniref:inter-alpha-trypsin inhibitor heavy chain H3-like n=1 Tax=Gigantopelta aegis TaxID=1735272 RepID=UPI001B88822D|nr:inter-alpha-trypsin inhibitor heavy chain H3-like [Gigantopelta aegis]
MDRAWVIVWIVGVFANYFTYGEDKHQFAEPPEIYSLHIISDIKFRFATTLITSRIANPNNVSADVAFDVTLPNTAFISNFTLEIEGKVYPATVKEKAEAKKEYDRAKQRGKTAGHVSKRVRETNKFRVEVNVAARTKVTFNLTYEEVLKRRLGVYQHVIFVDPGQLVEDLKIDVALQESRDIISLRVPPIKNELLTDVDITASNDLAHVQRPDSKSAYIRFHPSLDEQLVRWAEGISGLFTLEYDLNRGYDAGDVLISNGYFVHFFAPNVSEPIPRDVLFILDTSTSMYNTKMDQMKEAMKNILDDLQEGDTFNIQEFNSRAKMWKDTLQPVNRKTIRQALQYIQKLRATGWTNINQALTQGLDFLNNNARHPDSGLLIFLTDGKATKGEQDNGRILQNVMTKNKMETPIYSLAFGRGADWEFVKKVGIQNNGLGKRIYEDSDADLQIRDFYKEISTTLLEGINFLYPEDLVDTDSLTKSSFKNFFEGSEMIIAGKLDDITLQSLTMNVIANAVEGPVDLQLHSDVPDLQSQFRDMTGLTDPQNLAKITERMWAYLTIKEILEKQVGEKDRVQKELLKQKAIELSLKYQFVTPVTSMIVTKPEEDEVGDLDDDSSTLSDSGSYSGLPRTSSSSSSSSRSSSSSSSGSSSSSSGSPGLGWGGRGASRGGGGGDPHFMVKMEGLTYPICFDVRGHDGEIYQLVRDPITDLTINTKLKKGKKHTHDGGYRVYMQTIAVRLQDTLLLATTDKITLNKETLDWQHSAAVRIPGAWLIVNQTTLSFRLVFDFGLEVDVTKHVHPSKYTLGEDFLNIEVENEGKLSQDTDGILGQFVHKIIHLRSVNYRNDGKEDRIMGHLKSRPKSGKDVRRGRAWLVQRRDYASKQISTCWMLRYPASKLFDHRHEFYLIDDILHH